MKSCNVCATTAKFVTEFSVSLNGKNVYTKQLCPNCRDSLLDHLPQYEHKIENILPPEFQPQTVETSEETFRIVSQEQLDAIMAGDLNIESLPATIIKPPCPNCGLEHLQLLDKGSIGCATCYDHFAEDILAGLSKHPHQGTQHVGKNPMKNLTERKKTLKLLLAKAKEIEDWSKASMLEQELRDLGV